MRSLSILLVDDDNIERLKFKKVCQEVNIVSNVFEAKDGETALSILEDDKISFNLIISDLNMPKMDGFEFIKTLNQHPKFKYIPVVVMSTSDNKIDLERCYELGVSGYFTKPLKYSDYIKNVTSLLEYWQKTTYLKE